MNHLDCIVAAVIFALALSCGDDSDGPKSTDGGSDASVTVTDGSMGDSGKSADTGGPGPDGSTPCETETCSSGTEICVACNCGGPTSFHCVPVPAGCESDRACSCLGDDICGFTAVEAWCVDQSQDNVILCETGLD